MSQSPATNRKLEYRGEEGKERNPCRDEGESTRKGKEDSKNPIHRTTASRVDQAESGNKEGGQNNQGETDKKLQGNSDGRNG